MKIGRHELGGKRAFVIAEAGTCHADGNTSRSVTRAELCVDRAYQAGADAVKFQIFDVPGEPLFCPLDGDGKRWPRWVLSYLVPGDWWKIKGYAEALGLVFLASAFQKSVVQMLVDMDLAAYKVASRAALSYPYEMAPGPFLISTGMIFNDHTDSPAAMWELIGDKEIEWMQCTSKYPTPLNEAVWADSMIGPEKGFSDHSGTPWPAIDAMARGCPLVEVHFAPEPDWAGPDKAVALTPEQLKLVCEARDAFAAMHSD